MFKSKETTVHLIDGKKYKIVDSYSGKYLMVQRKDNKWYSIYSTTPKGKKIFNEIWNYRKGHNELSRKRF